MLERQHDQAPKLFAWRGHCYHVEAVERSWTKSRGGLRGQVECTCFRVRVGPRGQGGTGPERFEICRDAQRDTWHMERRLATGVGE